MSIPIPACPSPTSLSQQTCNGFLQGTLSFYYIHFLHFNTNISISSGILTCFTHDMAKTGASRWCNKLQWYTRYNTGECKSKCVKVYAFIFNISNNLSCELIFSQKIFHLFFQCYSKGVWSFKQPNYNMVGHPIIINKN